MMHRSIALWLAGTSVAALASQAQAADAVAPAPTVEAAQATPIETVSQDIIVTAQKRSQLLIDVPQSITVVGGKTLEAQHANSFEDYLKLVPGLQLNQDTPGEGRLIFPVRDRT